MKKINTCTFKEIDLARLLRTHEATVQQIDPIAQYACYFTERPIDTGYRILFKDEQGAINRIYVSAQHFDQILDKL
jgi:hypothetical protein